MADNPIAPLIMMFRIHDHLISQSLQGIGDEQVWSRPLPQSNPMMWLIGHVVQSRAHIITRVGGHFDTGWRDRFRRGAEVGGSEQYPPRAEIEAKRIQVNRAFFPALEALDAAALSVKATGPVPAITNVQELLTFLTMHEGYHIGQIAYLRKGLGFPGLIG